MYNKGRWSVLKLVQEVVRITIWKPTFCIFSEPLHIFCKKKKTIGLWTGSAESVQNQYDSRFGSATPFFLCSDLVIVQPFQIHASNHEAETKLMKFEFIIIHKIESNYYELQKSMTVEKLSTRGKIGGCTAPSCVLVSTWRSTKSCIMEDLDHLQFIVWL